MKVHIVGGGPAGLYFAILMKKAWPHTRITVFERNRPDDTFGFGVVFSDQTLDTFEAYDRESYRAIIGHFAYWDDIEIHFRGTVHRIGGNGFCGCSRTTLLKILRPPRALARRRHQVPVRGRPDRSRRSAAPISWSRPTASIRARARRSTDQFKPTVELRPNHFVWMGSTQPLDAFNFFFRETEHGIFIAHCYQYQPGRSTWIFETDPETFAARRPRRARRGRLAPRFMEEVFAEELDGHKLITNRSIWRNFPTIRCERWTARQHRADRRRQGDRAFLHRLGHQARDGGRDRALRGVPRDRRARRQGGARALRDRSAATRSRSTQHSADVSLVWFEHVKRFWDMDPTRFAFGLMTRSQAPSPTTTSRCARRSSSARPTRWWRARSQALGFEADVAQPVAPMFQPFQLRGMTLANRVVVSPMCQYSAQDGLPGDWHLVHYGSRAIGGAGLMFTEMTDVSAEARITHGCTGMYNDAQEAAWKRIVDFVHANSAAKFCLQLGHAGRKGATKLMWEGIDQPLPSRAAGRSCRRRRCPTIPHSQVPREMTRADMDQVDRRFRRRRRSAASAPASTCSSCTPRTAICWRASSRR